MTNPTDVEAQLRSLLRDAYDRVDCATDFEDRLLRAADRSDHTPRRLFPRVGAGLLAAALVAGVAIGAVAVSHRQPRPATPAASASDIRMLKLGVAPGAGLTIVGATSGYGGNARHLVQTLELRGSAGSYLVEALQAGEQLATIYRLPALAWAQRVSVGGHPGYYFPCVRGGTTCPPVLAWLYRPHAWATITSNTSTAASALGDVATAIRFTDHTPMRMAVALPYAPQRLRPTALMAQYPAVRGLGHSVVQSGIDYGSERNGGTPIVGVSISRESLSAKQRAGTPVKVDEQRAYLRQSDRLLTLDFAPAPHQVVEVTSISWTKSELISFASQLRFAVNLTDINTWFDARSAVP